MRTDLVSLASGAVIAALGALVLLDTSGALDVSLGWMAVALIAGIGAMLVAGGLLDGDVKAEGQPRDEVPGGAADRHD